MLFSGFCYLQSEFYNYYLTLKDIDKGFQLVIDHESEVDLAFNIIDTIFSP